MDTNAINMCASEISTLKIHRQISEHRLCCIFAICINKIRTHTKYIAENDIHNTVYSYIYVCIFKTDYRVVS